MKKISRFFAAFFFVLFLIVNQGCVPLLIGVAAGAGGVTYAKGKYEQNVDYPVKDVHSAALSALKSMELFITDDDLELHSSHIHFKFDDGKKGKIDVEALTEKTSKVIVRIGILGDEVKSQMIMNGIENKLKSGFSFLK